MKARLLVLLIITGTIYSLDQSLSGAPARVKIVRGIVSYLLVLPGVVLFWIDMSSRTKKALFLGVYALSSGLANAVASSAVISKAYVGIVPVLGNALWYLIFSGLIAFALNRLPGLRPR